uniref:PARP catalytic domain-containing protein n=1 Tax=Pygocentrus nattereri TaxID=42514 RepID=A0A3B4CT08_PYGNA
MTAHHNFTIGLQRYMDKGGYETYIMFHGTTLRNALQIIQNGFVPSQSGMLGPGVYVTRSFQKASAYPKHPPPGEEQAILQLSVHVGKVIKINYQGHPLQKTWHQVGYDTAWVPPNCGVVPSGLEEDCVWDPQRIESSHIACGEKLLILHALLKLKISKGFFGIILQKNHFWFPKESFNLIFL